MELGNPIPPLHLLSPRWHQPSRYLNSSEKEACLCWPGSRVSLYTIGCWQTLQSPPSVSCMSHVGWVHRGWNVELFNETHVYDDNCTEMSSLISCALSRYWCTLELLYVSMMAIVSCPVAYVMIAMFYSPLIQCSDQSQLVSCADILMAISSHWKMCELLQKLYSTLA